METKKRLKGSEKPFNLRIENALKGWQTADAEKLDKIGKKIEKMLKGLTCRDIITHYEEFDSFSDLSDQNLREEAKNYTIKILEESGSPDTPIIDYIQKLSRDLVECQEWKSSHILDLKINTLLSLKIGQSFHNWIEKNLKTNSQPELQAKIIYLATGIENPFIYINDDVKQNAELSYLEVNSLEKKLDPTKKDETIKRYSTFLNETRYGANCKELNAWGYADQTCRETLYLIDNPSLKENNEGLSKVGQKFKYDLMLFCENQKCFPPQIFFILNKVKKLYPKTKNHIEALDHFYKEHSEGLFKYFQGQLNFTVSGVNRIYERLDLIADLNKDNSDGVYLSLFSGPPSISKAEAKLYGCKECITVDSYSGEELKSMKHGGQGLALLLRNELLPGQNTDHVLGSDPKTDINHNHIQGWLPDDNFMIEEKIKNKKISVISDKRGSGLYLQGQKKLEYLVWLFNLGRKNPGVVINYDTGVPNWLYVNFVLRGNGNNGYDLVDYFSGLSTKQFKKTYLGHSGRISELYGGNTETIRFLEKIIKLIPIDIKAISIAEKDNSIFYEMDKIVEAFYYITNPSDYNFKNLELDISYSYLKNIIHYFDYLRSNRLKEAKLFLQNVSMKDSLKKILRTITPSVFHKIIYLFSSQNNISVSREGIFFPHLCKRIDFEDDHREKEIKAPAAEIKKTFEKKNKASHVQTDLNSFDEVEKILHQKFRMKIPPDLMSLINQGQIQQIEDKIDYGQNTFDRHTIFLIGNSLTSIALFEQKKLGGYKSLAFRFASVVKCEDNIERIIAINYIKTENGWVASEFNISTNGFSENYMDYHTRLFSEPFPTPTGHPLYTAAMVTPEMVEALNDSEEVRGLRFSTSDHRNEFDEPRRLTNGDYNSNFKITTDSQKDNFLFLCDSSIIFKFPTRFKGKKVKK